MAIENITIRFSTEEYKALMEFLVLSSNDIAKQVGERNGKILDNLGARLLKAEKNDSELNKVFWS